ncbi:serine/threonine protein phosphatase (plasmid) [Rhizobium rosettiformans]|uniref:Serine/threonine protein phosphatase n=1 Tax=Rhizobium rosettiformans TaxID=1368430 RepID=A0ABX7F1B4_9HYPH|nr:metallophosphoesterase family protein [Rhizobium rosettiformans]QRF54345.1 serine/threonine protein phosphatase [Rhizobium rosettiformans]
MKSWLASLFDRKHTSSPNPLARVTAEPHFAAVYAVGDVHGCLNELLAIERKIIADGQKFGGEKLIVMLGDYIDRGPSSASVIEHLLKPPPETFRRICLMGNHDQMFLEFWRAPSIRAQWLGLGGDETLASYGIYLADHGNHPLVSQLHALVPQEHIEFLAQLPVMLRVGRYCFVHAGIDPSLPLDEQLDDVLLTSRPHQFAWNRYSRGEIVIHGHTPVQEVDLSAPSINLDLKVYETGQLAALRMLDDKLDVILSS